MQISLVSWVNYANIKSKHTIDTISSVMLIWYIINVIISSVDFIFIHVKSGYQKSTLNILHDQNIFHFNRLHIFLFE